MRNLILQALFSVFALVLSQVAVGQEAFNIVIKDHKFAPNVLRVPAGQRIKLFIDNQDESAEEFESHTLRVEKIIAGKSKAQISIGPLKPGKYVFFGEFNPSTATGQLIAE